MPFRPNVWVVRGDVSGIALPVRCAGCGSPTVLARALRRPGAADLLIPYCSSCLAAIARSETRAIGVGIASCVLALGLALVFPVAWPSAGLSAHIGCALGGAVLLHPIARLLWGPAHGPSVRWSRKSELVCDDPEFARDLAERNALTAVCKRGFRIRWHVLEWLAVAIVLLLAPISHFIHHPPVRIVNLSGEWLSLRVDGVPEARIAPTLGETPSAGLWLRLPRGERRIEAISDAGQVVSDVRVQLRSGRDHLYAPGSERHCFWLEETRYGKVSERRVVPLPEARHFWQLESSVDTWFVASPEPAPASARSSGGVLTALRHAPCASLDRDVDGLDADAPLTPPAGGP